MNLQLKRLSLPTSAISISVLDYAFDRIEVEVTGDAPEVLDRRWLEERFVKTAVAAVNLMLQHLRVLTGAAFLVGLEEHYRPQDGCSHFLFPRSLTWFDAKTAAPFSFYGEFNAAMSGGAFISPERGSVPFSALMQSLQSGPPDLAKSLLIDAEVALVTLRLREAVISLALVCEVSSNEFLRRKNAQSEKEVKKILNRRDSFAQKRFHLVLLHLGIDSFESADPVSFDLVEQLYKARNAAAHASSLEFHHKNVTIVASKELVTTMRQATLKLVAWLATK